MVVIEQKQKDFLVLGILAVGLALMVAGYNLGQWLTFGVGMVVSAIGFGLGRFFAKKKKVI